MENDLCSSKYENEGEAEKCERQEVGVSRFLNITQA